MKRYVCFTLMALSCAAHGATSGFDLRFICG